MKFDSNAMSGRQLFGITLDELIPKKHPIRIKLDKLDWDALESIAKEAYKTDWYQSAPNPRIMIGLFVYSCLADKRYRELEEEFSFNNICQYACGFNTIEYRTLDHTTLIKFEQHLGFENICKIKDMIEKISVKKQPPRSKGNHSFDTTVTESDITFPTDTKLMEKVRLFCVKVITTYQKEVGQNHRHYGRVARTDYVDFCKKRKPNKKVIKQIKKKQLQYLKRNLKQANEVILKLEELTDTKQRKKLVKKLKSKLLVAWRIYEQQKDLYEGKKVKDRIVSFHRPEIRPIFRGKTKQSTEFGVKLGVSICGKALILGKIDYNNFYDGHGLKDTVREIKNKGHPINEMIGDKGNGGCQRFLKAEGIKDGIERRGKQKVPKSIPKKRFVRARNRMEGAFGTIKNVFGLMRMRAKTEYGEQVKIMKAFVGYNMKYTF